MAERELYEILLKIAAEADPSAHKELKSFADHWRDHGLAVKKLNQDLAKLAQEEKRLADAEREVTKEAEHQAGVLSGLIGILRDVAVVTAGILLRDILVGGIRRVREFAATLRDMAAGFVAGVKDVNEQMDFYRAQLTALLGGAQQAIQAIDHARRMAIVTPLFGVAELVNATRLLTAFGLNYERWMPVIASTAAATGSSLQQIANAFGMIASGATTRGLYYLKIAGINVRDAGIEFDKSGQAIGSTQEILEALEVYLRERYGALMPEMARTWRGSIEAMRDMWYQFRWQLGLPTFEIVRDKLAAFQEWLTENQDNILAFAYVLGEYPARALQRFLDFLGEVTGEIDFQAQDFFRGAVNLMVSFADGLLTALDQYVLPAVVGIADLIASFLLGTSPPPRGPLSRVYQGAIAVMKTYLLALKEGVDFQGLREIAGFIQAALTHAVAIGDLPEEQLAGFVIRAREMIARAIGEIGRIGGVSAPTLAELSAFLGPIFADVQEYLGLLAQLKAATDAVAAAQQRLAEAQEWVAEAAEVVRKAQDRLRRFEIATAEIPERFTRGRRRELELAIQQAEEERRRRQEAVRVAQQQLRAAQEQVRAVKEQISLQRAYMSEMQRIWRLQQEQAKAQEEGTEAWRDTVPELKNVGEELDKLKEKWRPILDEIFKDFERLEKHWHRLGDFVRGILGIRPEYPAGVGWDPGQVAFSESYKQGERFRDALDTIRNNLYKIGDKLVDIKDTFVEIVTTVAPWIVDVEGLASAWNTAWENIDRIKGTLKAIRTFLDEHPEIKRLLGIVTRVSGAISPLGPPSTMEEAIPMLGWMPFTKMIGTWADIAMETLGLDKSKLLETWDKNIIQALLELLRGADTDVEDAAEEGFKDPLIDVAEDTKKELVGRSIFPDMIRDIVTFFRELPRKLYPYLVSLYNTVTTWADYTADAWIQELEDMTEAADSLVDVLRTLLALLERISRIMGGVPTGVTHRHAGGPIFRTGQYQLQAGEYVLSREQAAMAGAGAGFFGGTFNFIHNWPEGIEKLRRPEIQKMAEKAAFKAFHKLMRESGRD